MPQGDSSGVTGERKFLRLRVFNRGLTTALDVQVIIGEIRTGSPEKWTFAGEVLDAVWSQSPDPKMDIPSKTPRFADLCACDYSENAVPLIICIRGSAHGLDVSKLRGAINFEIYVAARNAKTVKKTVKVQFDGAATGLRYR